MEQTILGPVFPRRRIRCRCAAERRRRSSGRSSASSSSRYICTHIRCRSRGQKRDHTDHGCSTGTKRWGDLRRRRRGRGGRGAEAGTQHDEGDGGGAGARTGFLLQQAAGHRTAAAASLRREPGAGEGGEWLDQAGPDDPIFDRGVILLFFSEYAVFRGRLFMLTVFLCRKGLRYRPMTGWLMIKKLSEAESWSSLSIMVFSD